MSSTASFKIICETLSDFKKKQGLGVSQLLPTLYAAYTTIPITQAFIFTICSLKGCLLLFPQTAVLAT